jgi:ferric-dicitrate binding protein FerR (iron transport regulator)
MSLSDRETLELNELCGAVTDGTLTAAQRARLERWLVESEEARRHYVRMLGQSASLHAYAAENHAEAPDAAQHRSVNFGFPMRLMVGLAAAVVFGLGLWLARLAPPWAGSESASAGGHVAHLSGLKNSRWVAVPLRPGDRLARDQRVELAAGLAEITFDSGARVVLEGPAVLEINSAWAATLRHGTLKASVPAEAIGFRISNAAVEVVDLGTEFTMIADARGAEVLVLKGEVEAAPRPALEQPPILLRENESRRFAAGGVTEVSDRARKFAHFNDPIALDRLMPVTRLVHWGFDEVAGDRLEAERAGAPPELFPTQLHLSPAAGEVRIAGQIGRALRFDGSVYARASVPGISESTPHTIAFWVRVPEDAPLSDAYSMVTWITRSRKLGNRHAGINWNRDRTEGPLGVLRTDFRGGHAFGTTSLRDGRWHHIAVIFAPGDDHPDTPVQVRQYVDGCLESSTVIPGRKRGPAVAENAALTDIVWLGRRLGPGGPLADRFRGDLDELFIVDRGLEPQEIVSLMNHNRLPASVVAANP